MTRKINRIVGIGIFSMFFYYHSAYLLSQDKTTPASRTIEIERNTVQKDSLPKVNLPEFVITGKEKIELPIEQKPEIKEINIFIPPKTDPIVTNERDFSTSELDMPLKRFTMFGPEKISYYNYIKAGYGKYNTLLSEAGIFYNWDKHALSLSGSYNSSDGHTKNADFKNGYVGISYGSILSSNEDIFNNSKIKIDLKYSMEKFKFYGITYFPDMNYPFPPFNNEFPKRDINNFSLESLIESSSDFPIKYQFEFLLGNFQTQDNQYQHSDQTRETKLNTKLNLSTAIQNYNLFCNTNFYLGELNDKAAGYSHPKYFNFNFGAQGTFFTKLDLKLVFAYFVFKNARYNIDNVYPTDNFRIFPQFFLQYFINNSTTLFLNYKPEVENVNYETSLEKYKYLFSDIEVKHLIRPIDISLGAFYGLNKDTRFIISIDYFEQENTPIYGLPWTIYYINNIFFPNPWPWNITYIENTVSKSISGEMQLFYQVDKKMELDFMFKYIHSRLNSKNIPYTPDFILNSQMRYYAPYDITLIPEIQIIGKRNTYYGYNEHLDPYFMLNLSCEYQIFNNLKAFVNFKNILNQNYYIYDGYSEVPFTLSGGLTFKW